MLINEQKLLRLDMNLTSKNRYERPLAMAMTLQKKEKNKLGNTKQLVEKTLISHFHT